MTDPVDKTGTPFDIETPRRDAMRSVGLGVAGAALLGALGLGATAEAKSKNNRVKAERRRRRRGKQGATGPQGPQGPAGGGAGGTGPTGPQGPAGPTSIDNFIVTSRDSTDPPVNVGPGALGTSISECNVGEVLIGGSYRVFSLGAGCFVNDSSITPGNPPSWGVTIECPAGGGSATGLVAKATCLSLDTP